MATSNYFAAGRIEASVIPAVNGFWVEVGGERYICKTLKDAYRTITRVMDEHFSEDDD